MDKQLYRGVGGVYILWHGEWTDPELECNGMRVNYWDVEHTMYGHYLQDCNEKDMVPVAAKFTRYCMDNVDQVRQLIEEIWNQSNK